jgi:hypothetical protein
MKALELRQLNIKHTADEAIHMFSLSCQNTERGYDYVPTFWNHNKNTNILHNGRYKRLT